MKRFSGDPAFRFFYGMALVLEGRVQEGIRELDPLQGYSEVMLGSLLALIHAHKQCLTVDKENDFFVASLIRGFVAFVVVYFLAYWITTYSIHSLDHYGMFRLPISQKKGCLQ